MRLCAGIAALTIVSGFIPLLAQNEGTLEVVGRIKSEAFDHSKVMEQLYYLTDVYGPRLTGSPQFEQAAQWAAGRLKDYGVSNVHTEKWGPFGRSWSVETYTVDMTEPRYSHLVAAPLAWSAPTDGFRTGQVIYAPIPSGSHLFDFKTQYQEFEKYKAEWKGKLHGKIVLASESEQPPPSTEPLFRRYSDADLAKIAEAPEPTIKRSISVDELDIPTDPAKAEQYLNSLSDATFNALIDRYFEQVNERARFFHNEGVLGVIQSDKRSHNGLIHAEEAGSHLAKDPAPPPTLLLPKSSTHGW